ncbi:MAG: ATP-binding cassette domain-containing protein [Clostridia bacterium]|nr:ATP-binding cassette domain-containing protein [Clostridia bacterium]
MLKVEGLVKRYGKIVALDGISFSADKGEIVGLLGPNGAGKSTAMNIITGYLSSDEGTVTVDGDEIMDNPGAVKKKIGYLPEIPPLYPDMTVAEYMDFVYELKKCSLPKKEHLEEIARVAKTTEVQRRLIGNLSKGYRQRVGIAEALVGDPPILIFDEPTVGLDPGQVIEVRSLIRRLGRKHTVILSTHILSEVQAVCDRIVIIDRGKIIADEKSDDIASAVNRSRRYAVKICGSASEVLPMLRAVDGVSGVEVTGERELDAYTYIVESEKGREIRRAIFAACADKGLPLIGLEQTGMSLEEVFIKLTEKK